APKRDRKERAPREAFLRGATMAASYPPHAPCHRSGVNHGAKRRGSVEGRNSQNAHAGGCAEGGSSAHVFLSAVLALRHSGADDRANDMPNPRRRTKDVVCAGGDAKAIS